VKAKQTYIKMSSFHCTLYLQVNISHCKGTPPYVVASQLMRQYREVMHVSLPGLQRQISKASDTCVIPPCGRRLDLPNIAS
jgi:hypothetical protein